GHSPTTNSGCNNGAPLFPKRITQRSRDRGEISFYLIRLLLFRSTTLVETTDETGIELSRHKLFVFGNFTKEREGGRDSRNFILIERAPQTFDRFLTSATPNSELRDHRIVVN